MTLPGPSRTIVVEPLEIPLEDAPPAPEPAEPPPSRAPDPEPDREPVPA